MLEVIVRFGGMQYVLRLISGVSSFAPKKERPSADLCSSLACVNIHIVAIFFE